MSPSWLEHRPGGVLGAATVGFAVATMGLVGTRSTLALLGTAGGVVALTAGLVREERRIAGLGVLFLLAGVLVGGAAGIVLERLLPATATALLSGEFGLGAFAMRDELRGGSVERAELLHVATATGVGALVTGGTYALYRTVTAGVSVTAVVFLLVAAVALGLALRD